MWQVGKSELEAASERRPNTESKLKTDVAYLFLGWVPICLTDFSSV
jgi:hypothetical protein